MNPYEINNELEKQLCEYTGAKYCVAVNSGSAGFGENGTLVNTPVRQHDTT